MDTKTTEPGQEEKGEELLHDNKYTSNHEIYNKFTGEIRELLEDDFSKFKRFFEIIHETALAFFEYNQSSLTKELYSFLPITIRKAYETEGGIMAKTTALTGISSEEIHKKTEFAQPYYAIVKSYLKTEQEDKTYAGSLRKTLYNACSAVESRFVPQTPKA